MNNYVLLSIRSRYDKFLISFLNIKLKIIKKKFNKELKDLFLNSYYFDIYYMRFYRDKFDDLIKYKIKNQTDLVKLIKIKFYLFFKLCLFCLNSILNGMIILIFKKKHISNKSSHISNKSLIAASILLDCFYGCSNVKKNDLPFNKKKINKKKLIYLIRDEKIYENCKLDKDFSKDRILFFSNKKIKYLNIRNKIPLILDKDQTGKILNLILTWFKSPLKISIIMKFYFDYIIYLAILNYYQIEIYVDPKPGADQDSLVISYAMSKKGGESISFQRSYISNKEHSSFIYGCETLICWSKDAKNKTHETNNIKKFIFYPPPFGGHDLNKDYIIKLKKKIQNRQVLTIFDTSFTSGISLFSKDTYNQTLDFILKETLKRKNIFLILKLKNFLSLKNISHLNQELINTLVQENRSIIIDENYKTNNELIFISNFICSFNSLTIFSEAIYQKKKILAFNNLSLENELIKKINKLDSDLCVNNLEDFKNIFYMRIEKENKAIDFSSIKDILFSSKNNIKKTLISKYFAN